MLPEIGLLCVIAALTLAGLAFFSLIFTRKLLVVNVIRPLTLGQIFFIWCGLLILIYCFVHDDFTVQYVAHHSHSLLPLFYKVTAVWGGHEGSLLLWVVILSVWMLLFILRTDAVHKLWFSNQVLAVLSGINFGLLMLLLFSANPFARAITTVPLDGVDLNPLLQDIAMILHPPILYVGYVGMSMAFAFAVVALLDGEVDYEWAQRLRGWVLIAWSFLTVGITLGSWWAYYELGWGGWWFWDPVENASFMPWLLATALLHCLQINLRTGRFLLLVILLGISAFALSLFGTFLVRSGLIMSVHAFVSESQRGVLLLGFLGLVVISALVLFAWRAPKLAASTSYPCLTRMQKGLFANNILLLTGCATVLLGTVYPLVHEALFTEKIAVGYPYFNAVFVPQMLLLLLVLLVTLQSNWWRLLGILSGLALVVSGFLYWWFGAVEFYSVLGLVVAIAIVGLEVRSYWRREYGLVRQGAHIGLALVVIGMSITPLYEIERDVRMRYGDNLQIGGYRVDFMGVKAQTGVNYVAEVARLVVSKNGRELRTLLPEKRHYLSQDAPITETSILPGVFGDLYTALGQQLSVDEWSLRIYYKPFVRWIWCGALVMALAALLSGVRRIKSLLVVGVRSNGLAVAG